MNSAEVWHSGSKVCFQFKLHCGYKLTTDMYGMIGTLYIHSFLQIINTKSYCFRALPPLQSPQSSL